MSTFARLYLNNTADRHIQKLNRTLKKLGYPVQVYDGIYYGPFPSPSHLEHYAKWLTEDPEGQNEVKHFSRPVTSKFLQTFHWNEIGCFFLTLNNISESDIQECQILFNYAFANPQLFNWSRSNSQQQLLQQYGFSFSEGKPTQPQLHISF